MAEVLPGWGRDGSQMLLAPAGTPRPVLNLVNREIARVLDLADVRERLQAVGFHIGPSTPEEQERTLRSDIEVFSRVGKAAGLVAK